MPEDQVAELPELEEGQFPPYVTTDAERIRFRTAVGIARQLFQGDEAQVWVAARSMFNNPEFED